MRRKNGPESQTRVRSKRPTAKPFAFGSIIAQSSPHSFSNQAAFQFGDCPEHGEHHPARWRRRVERLRQAHKLDSQRVREKRSIISQPRQEKTTPQVLDATGLAKAEIRRLSRTYQPANRVVGDTKLAGDNQTLWGAIGWATPAAFGAAMAAPDRRTVLITGEGSHQLTAQEVGQFHRTYTINSDCTGTKTVNTSVGITVHEAIIVIGGGQRMIGTQTDPWAVVQSQLLIGA